MAATARVIDIHVVADSTGDTGTRVARATQAQFPGQPVRVVRHPRLHSPQGVDDVVAQLRAEQAWSLLEHGAGEVKQAGSGGRRRR